MKTINNKKQLIINRYLSAMVLIRDMNEKPYDIWETRKTLGQVKIVSWIKSIFKNFENNINK